MFHQAGEKKSYEFWSKLDMSTVLISILDSINEGIIICDDQGWVQYVNPAFLKITGLNLKARIGKNIFDIAQDCPLSIVLKTGKSVYSEKFKMYDVDMEIFTSVSPIIIKNQLFGAVAVFQDVSELRGLAAELNKTQQRVSVLNTKLESLTESKYRFDDLVGTSSIFRKTVQIAKRVAKTESTIIITGESGTGKELFAHSIHSYSMRGNKEFIAVNCAAIPNELLESEFFGHEKGSFTGANKRKLGKFEIAHGGTIFLDEIGELELPLQAKFLRFLEDGCFYRIGGNQPVKVDVRIITATNRDLKLLVKQGKFREDLYYRLNVINIRLPSLRERKEDIIQLAEFFLQSFNRKYDLKIEGFSKEACEILNSYSWPGNIRELRNCIERVAILSKGNIIGKKDLQFLMPDKVYDAESKILPLDVMERKMIEKALDTFGYSLEGKKKASD